MRPRLLHPHRASGGTRPHQPGRGALPRLQPRSPDGGTRMSEIDELRQDLLQGLAYVALNTKDSADAMAVLAQLAARFERVVRREAWDEGGRAYVASLGFHPLHPLPPNPYRNGGAS